jgi:hypothetical protein
MPVPSSPRRRGRRWVAEAIAAGVLTVDALRNDATATRALHPKAILPVQIDPAGKPGPVASEDGPEEAAELLDDFLITLLELPGDTRPDLAAALPDELYDRIDQYIERCLRNPKNGRQFSTAPLIFAPPPDLAQIFPVQVLTWWL